MRLTVPQDPEKPLALGVVSGKHPSGHMQSGSRSLQLRMLSECSRRFNLREEIDLWRKILPVPVMMVCGLASVMSEEKVTGEV